MSTIRCPQCNLVHFATDSQCKRCGAGLFASEPENNPTHFVGESEPFREQAQENYGYNSTQEYETKYGPRHDYGNYQQTDRFPLRSAKTKTGLAIFSLIAGIFSLPPISTIGAGIIAGAMAVGFGVKGAILGVVIVMALIPIALISGLVAMSRAKKSPNVYGGRGCAIGGVVCSSISLVIIPVIAAIAIPNLLAARRAANEGSAVSSLRTLARSQDVASQQYPSSTCSDLQALAGMGLIDSELQKGVKSGYKFEVSKTLAGGCEMYATPVSTSTGGRSFYYSTADGILRAAAKNGRKADKTDAPLSDSSRYNGDTPKIALQPRQY